VEIQFRDSKLEKLCLSFRDADRQLGSNSAKKLRARLADLEAVNCVSELIAGRPHPLSGDRDGEFAVDLSGGSRLVFEPSDESIPRKEDGGIDWSAVESVRIIFIGDYHE
jgi:proteic killer suppression protein